MKKKNGIRLLALFMTVVMSVTIMPARMTSVASMDRVKKAAVQDDKPAQEQTSDAGGGTDKVLTYDTSVVEQDILYSHTDRSSELPNDQANPTSAEERTMLSGEQGLYDDLGLPSASLSDQLTTMVDSNDYQNPMSGFTMVDPEELLIGSVGSRSGGSNDHSVSIFACDNQELKNPEELAPSIDGLKKNTTEWVQYKEQKSQQAHNGVGFDCDGDRLDEFAYVSLASEDGSKYGIEVYERDQLEGDASCWTKFAFWQQDMDDDNYVLDIPAGEAKGYTSITAGDFDGDGKDELAVYIPDVSDHKGKKCEEARIQIVKFNKNTKTGTPIETIYLKEILKDYGDMGKEWYLPSVSLSTSHLRLGAPIETGGVTKYNPVCDLVINVNVPKVYDSGSTLNKDSTTSIYGFAEEKILKTFEYKPLNYSRMGAVNTCEADLNGDGYDEIVAAGIKEEKLKYSKESSNDSRARGSFTGKKNFVNIIYYDGKEYQMLWTEGGKPSPLELDASGNTSPSSFKSVEPIAMCAGHYDVMSPRVQDQLCIQDTIYSCEGTRITGKTIETDYGSNGDVSYCIIPDTAPYQNKENFAGRIHFEQLFQYDISDSDTVHATHTPWIDSVASGPFLTENSVDSIVMITSDYNSVSDDYIYFDVSIISHYRASETSTPEWKYKAYNDYVNRKNEDDGGTSIFATFINSDPDTYYYKYMRTTASYSTPVLYTVMQAPPFYREANTVFDNEFSIISGSSTYNTKNAGIGTGMKLSASVGFGPFFQMGVEVGANIDFLYAHTCSHNKTLTHSLYLKSDSDYAIVYVVPVVVNTYAVIKDPKKPEELEYFDVEEPVKPIFTALTVDQYNEAVKNAKERQQKGTVSETNPVFPADYNAPIIDKDGMIPPSTPGDPIGYAHEKSEVKKHVKSGEELWTASSDVTKTIDRTETSFSKETTDDYSLGVTGTVTMGVSMSGGYGAVKGGLEANNKFTAGVTLGKTSTDGIAYTVCYTGLSTSMPDGVQFSSYDDSYTELSTPGLSASRILHYDPSPAGVGSSVNYQYNTTACLYKMKDVKTDKDFVDDYLSGDADYQKSYHADSTVYAFSYYTSSNSIPPEPPTKLGVQSVRAVGDADADGRSALDITLAWDSKLRDPERDLSGSDMGYNLYVTDENANSKTIYLVNRDGLIRRNEGYDYTTYTMHLDKSEYRDSMKFYLVPAFAKTESGGITVNEGAVATSCSIGSVKNILDGRVMITEQPVGPLVYDTTKDSDITFTCKARKNTGMTGDARFDWQFINPKTNQWQSVKPELVKTTTATVTGLPQGGAAADPGITAGLPEDTTKPGTKGLSGDTYEEYTSVLSATIPQKEYVNYLGRPVRCVITCGTYSLNSDIVVISCARSADTPACELKAGDVEELGLASSDDLKASYDSSNQKAVKVNKSGKVYAMKKGTSTVKATYNGQTIEYRIKVKNSPKAVKKKLVMKLGQKKKIKIKGKVPYVKNKYFKNKLVRVSSSKDGKTVWLKAVKKGKGKVKIRVNGIILKVSVTVK